jgi:hypothetical protein
MPAAGMVTLPQQYNDAPMLPVTKITPSAHRPTGPAMHENASPSRAVAIQIAAIRGNCTNRLALSRASRSEVPPFGHRLARKPELSPGLSFISARCMSQARLVQILAPHRNRRRALGCGLLGTKAIVHIETAEDQQRAAYQQGPPQRTAGIDAMVILRNLLGHRIDFFFFLSVFFHPTSAITLRASH